MTSNIDLYDALKDRLGTEAARMLAEAVPQAQDLATKEDLRALRLEIKADLQEMRVELTRWMLAFFVPLWIAVFVAITSYVIVALSR